MDDIDEEEDEEGLKAELGPEELELDNITPIVIKIKKDEALDEEEETPSKARKARTFPCPDCDEMFSSRQAVTRHAKKTHGYSKCPFCDESLIKDSHRWPTHLVTYHLEEKENPLYQEILQRVEVVKEICQLCGLGFKTSKSLEFHMRNIHNSQTNKLACDQCDKLLKTERSLRVHKKQFHTVHSARFLCVECGAVMKSKAGLKDHIERFHSGQKFLCVECGRNFKMRKDLGRHIANVHTERERKFPCAQCDKSFYNFVDLKNHVALLHDKSQAKPWHCEVCPFKASRLGNLNQHRRKVHSEGNISRRRLIEMVQNDQHPFYTRDQLHLVQQGIN